MPQLLRTDKSQVPSKGLLCSISIFVQNAAEISPRYCVKAYIGICTLGKQEQNIKLLKLVIELAVLKLIFGTLLLDIIRVKDG